MEKIISVVARKLKFINPDIFSYLATVITVLVVFYYYFALRYPDFLLWAILFIIIRLFLNKLDGAVAKIRGNLSLTGQIVNALPDRYSDIILIMGMAFSSLCKPIYSLFGLASIFLVSYTGMLGKAMGVDYQSSGPLNKVERLILLMLFTVWQYVLLKAGVTAVTIFTLTLTPLEWCMVVFVILGQMTVINRLRGMSKQNAKVEWLANEKYKDIDKKILIAYDSQTGNTERVAEEISNCLKVGIRRIDDITNVETYDLVIFGSRESGSRPSEKVIEFLNKHRDIKNYAVFITYKNPILGRLLTGICFNYFKKALNKNPLATFSCKAAYKEEQLYQEHSTKDLLNAFIFGIRLTKKLKNVK